MRLVVAYNRAKCGARCRAERSVEKAIDPASKSARKMSDTPTTCSRIVGSGPDGQMTRRRKRALARLAKRASSARTNEEKPRAAAAVTTSRTRAEHQQWKQQQMTPDLLFMSTTFLKKCVLYATRHDVGVSLSPLARVIRLVTSPRKPPMSPHAHRFVRSSSRLRVFPCRA